MPNDKGYLSKYTFQNMKNIVNLYPSSKKLFKKFIGAKEFINNVERYCLWLNGVEPNCWRKIPPVRKAVDNVRSFRMDSHREATKSLAQKPYLFGEIRQPINSYLVIPKTTSCKRKYIPMAMESRDIIAGDSLFVMSNANMYDFGVLESKIHADWMKVIAGRLKSDYRYSAKIVYNNFPWPSPTNEQKEI